MFGLEDLKSFLFGVSNSQLRKAIEAEIKEGACFERLEFPLPGLKDFHLIQCVKRTPGSLVVAGLGKSRNEQAAYRMAIFEYFERKAVIFRGDRFGFDSTNGVAAHRYIGLARKAAENELFERDALLRHWYSQTPFIRMSLAGHSWLELISRELEATGYNLRVCHTYLGFLRTTLAFLVRKNSGGFALGLSSGRGTYEDMEKAVLEAAFNLYFGHEGISEEEWKSRVLTHGVKSLGDHRAHWLFVNSLPNWVICSEAEKEESRAIDRFGGHMEQVILSDRPVPVVGTRSRDILSLVLGDPGTKNLEIMARANLRIPNNKTLIHPIP